VQHLPSFSSSCQEELFPSSSYSRLIIPLLPRSVKTFSSTVLPPLSTFSSSTTLPPSHKNIFLYSRPTSTIIFSIVLPSTDNLILLSSPQKSFPP
jgi:hypothetical protein